MRRLRYSVRMRRTLFELKRRDLYFIWEPNMKLLEYKRKNNARAALAKARGNDGYLVQEM
jgi:hypothetical protein